MNSAVSHGVSWVAIALSQYATVTNSLLRLHNPALPLHLRLPFPLRFHGESREVLRRDQYY